MIHHCQAVRRGVREALLVADLPSGAYEASPVQAAASAIRLIKEGGASVVKPEGPSTGLAATITTNGTPVMGHPGLPQSVSMLQNIRSRRLSNSRVTNLKTAPNGGSERVILDFPCHST